MNQTTLTLAVDSTQVGTAAAAFDRMVNAGNAAAMSANKVASAALAEGRAIGQTLVPALNRGIESTRRMIYTRRELDQHAPRRVDRMPAGTAPGRQAAAPAGAGAGLGQLPGAATSAQGAVDRLTTAARTNRAALLQLSPAAEATVRNLRQLNATPIKVAAPQGLSAAAAVFAQASRVNPAPLRQIAEAFEAAANQAGRAATTVAQANRAIGATPRGGLTMAGAAPRAPLQVQEIVGAATGQRISTAAGFSTSEMTIEASRAQAAIERLTNAARDQRSALAQLTPAAAATAGAYRLLAATPAQMSLLSGRNISPGIGIPIPNRSGQNFGRPMPSSGGQSSGRPAPNGGGQGPDFGLSASEMQQLNFQLNDFFVQVASGGSALTALIQQGSQLSGTFGGVRPALQAVLSVFTPMRVAALGAATAVGVLAKAYHDGAAQSKAFADTILLTGNYAGQTEGKFNELAKKIAAGGQVTVGAAREAALAVAATGQIGPKVFNQVAEATALLSASTGKTASEVAANFAKMSDSPSRFAEEMNKSMHLWTSSEKDAIKAAEEAGRTTEAQIAVLDKLLPRLQKLDTNVGTIERTLRNARNAFAAFWDAALDVGREETVEEKIAAIDRKIQQSRSVIPWEEHGTARLSAGGIMKLEAERRGLVAKQKADEKKAADQAKKQADDESLDDAKKTVEGWTNRSRSAEAYRKELDKVNKAIAIAAAQGKPFSAAEQKTARDEVKRAFAPPKGPKDNSASQILAAQLQNDLRRIDDVFQQQRDAYDFQNAFIEAAYRNGNISIGALLEQRRQVIEGAAQAEVDALTQEMARLQEQLKQTKDPAERIQVQGQIEEAGARRDQVELRGSRDVVLLNQEAVASYRALGEQVTEYRASLLQLAGDEAGAAALRAQTAIANARLLAAQSGGRPDQITDAEVNALVKYTAAMDQYNEVQRRVSLLAANSARAEEAFALAAEQSGKSLLETERGIFALRAEELTQLGALTEKMKELAAASDNPAFKALAADLALSYAKAANAIDPALNRLRDANRQLAAGLAGTVSQAPGAFAETYSQRRSDARRDIEAERKEYEQRIDQLRGYLAQEKDERNKASLKRRIDQLQGESDGLKVESKGSSALKAFNDAVLRPMADQVFSTVNKVLIADPLESYFKGELTKLTERNGALAGFFKDALGIQADPKQMAQQQQTAAIQASSSALTVLATEAQRAATALASRSPASAAIAAAGRAPGAPDGFDPTQPPAITAEMAGAQQEAATSALDFGRQAVSATSDLMQLANAAGLGGGAMARLPGIVGLFQSAVAMLSSSGSGSGGGGIFSAIASLFGGASGGAGVMDYAAAVASTSIFHQGGIVGQPSESRNVPVSMFAGAVRYHTGGIAGQKPNDAVGTFAMAAGLKAGEVPAILMKNEEVLRADDPRHRDNLGMNILARIISEAGAPAARKDGEAGKPGQSAVSTLLQSIASSNSGSSASVLAEVLDRLGVKDSGESFASSVHKMRGARELGGPVSARSMYRVNEKGPELLQVAGKQYLMMGAQGGTVVPNGGGGSEKPKLEVRQQFVLGMPTSRATQTQVADAALRGLRRAAQRGAG